MIKLSLAKVKVGGRYDKSIRLHEKEPRRIKVEISGYEVETYDEYVGILLEYYKEGVNPRILSVDKIYPKGNYIMGIKGTFKEESYAGLFFELTGKDDSRGVYFIRMSNISGKLEIPMEKLREYWYKGIHIDSIHPFFLSKLHDTLASREGEADLKDFIRYIMRINRNRLSGEDKGKLSKLVSELQYPNEPIVYGKDKYYTVYRSKRIFSSVTIENAEGLIPMPDIGTIETETKDIAYYYSAILNYLVYYAIKKNLSFVRNLHAKPVFVIQKTNLSWNSTEDIRDDVVELSEEIHERAPRIYTSDHGNEKGYFEDLEKDSKFMELVELLNGYVSEKIGHRKLISKLSIVAG